MSHAMKGIKLVLLLVVLLLHFSSRRQAAKVIPLQARSFYTFAYRPAYSLLAGQGFHFLTLPNTPEALPLKEFEQLRRNRVTNRQLDTYFRSPDSKPVDFSYENAGPPYPVYFGELAFLSNPLSSTRILDVYVAALIWKAFGVSWSALFTFYALFSTVICYLVFQIARKLGASYWPGLLAALLFMASPFENDYAVRSIRDISPLWFGTVGFYAFICLLDQGYSAKWKLLSIFILGVCATLGCGWRPDVLLLPPFLLVALGVYLRYQGATWRYLGIATCLFLFGFGAVQGLLMSLCPLERQSPQMCFHMAYYGDFTRCNLLGLENSFQISRDDIHTCFTAQFYHQNQSLSDEPLRYISQDYGKCCRKMYFETLKYNGYHWLTRFPRFYFRALKSPLIHSLPMNGDFIPTRVYPPPWIKPPLQSLLQRLHRLCLYFFPVGVIAAMCFSAERIRAGSLIAFTFYYACVLFFVLPEEKHSGLLLLPVVVVSALGIWFVVRMCRPRSLWEQRISISRRGFIWATAALLGFFFVWISFSALTYVISARERKNYTSEILQIAQRGIDQPRTIDDPQRFSAKFGPEERGDPVGYLLEIKAGLRPGVLECSHIRYPHPLIPGRYCVTSHRLHPNRLQYFFVTCVHGLQYWDPRAYECSVVLKGDSEILSSTRLDLSKWKGLPVSTVFYEGEKCPGSPSVGGPTTRTLYCVPVELLAQGP